jgi:peroxiredoxin Q/BCP
MGRLDNHPLLNQKAPSLSLPNAAGETLSLDQWVGKQPVVIYFYPKNNTGVCTAQSCLFRDAYTQFQDAGWEVIGISNDSSQSHQAFSSQYQLPFILLSDPKSDARKAFKVEKTLGLLPGRVTYVLDAQGIIRLVFSSQLDAQAHIDEALAMLKQSEKKDPSR